MVGRMGDQSVVIRAEKGKVKMLVDGQDQEQEKELVCDARKEIKDESTRTSQKSVRLATENDFGIERILPQFEKLLLDGRM